MQVGFLFQGHSRAHVPWLVSQWREWSVWDCEEALGLDFCICGIWDVDDVYLGSVEVLVVLQVVALPEVAWDSFLRPCWRPFILSALFFVVDDV